MKQRLADVAGKEVTVLTVDLHQALFLNRTSIQDR
jgi:hypothetical protein